jgi:hypothetical protein
MPLLVADFAACRPLVRKFKKLRQKLYPGYAAIQTASAIKTAAARNEAASPAAALARCQLTHSSCARGQSGLRAAPFSGQAYGLAVLLQPFREPFVAKASHMSAVVSSRERCLRVASSFLERAKLDQRCYRAPEPASELSFVIIVCLSRGRRSSLNACARSSFTLAIASCFPSFLVCGDEHRGIVRNPTSGKPSEAKRGAKPQPCQYIRGQGFVADDETVRS